MKQSTALLMALVTAAPLTTITSAEAFNPAQLAQLKTSNSCSRCDLTFAPLEKATLTGAMLESAALMSANLRNAKLNSARLSYAMLSEANLSWATWTDGSTCDEGSIGQCKNSPATRGKNRTRGTTGHRRITA